MNPKSLSSSFADSIAAETLNACANIGEIGLDSFMNDGLWKDIPFLSTVASIYKLCTSIKGCYDLIALKIFLEEINKGCVSNDDIKKRREKFEKNSKFRDQELEYCIVLLDRYISLDKAKMLAKFYLSYLDGIISWLEFAEFSEIIDRLLPSDFEWMYQFMCYGGIHKKDFPQSDLSPVLRLQSLGLVMAQTDLLWGEMGQSKEIFSFYITETGKKFCGVLESELQHLRQKSENRI